MAGYLKAALYAATLLCAANAHAARYLTYTFETSGGGSVTGTRTSPVTVRPLQNMTFSFSFDADGGAVQDFPQGQSIYAGYGSGGSDFSVSDTGFGLNGYKIPGSFSDVFRLSLSATVYQNLGGVFAAGPLTVQSGSVSYTEGNFTGNTEYSGRVIAATVSESSNRPETIGLNIVNGVPEPSTWAMMLVGFGMTGYALRRRRARVVFA